MAEEINNEGTNTQEEARKAAEKWADRGDPEATRVLAELAGIEGRDRLVLLRRTFQASQKRSEQLWIAHNEVLRGGPQSPRFLESLRTSQLAQMHDLELRREAAREVGKFIDQSLQSNLGSTPSNTTQG